jgi:cell division protein FtsW
MRRTSSTLIAVVVLLLGLGIVMLASTSHVKASASFDDPYYFLKRQLAWLAVAIAGGVAVARVDYHAWRRWAGPLAVVSVLLLVVVWMPWIGLNVKGSSRWIRLGPFSVQPSELAKFTTVIGLSAWMARVGWRARRLKEGLLMPVAWLGLVGGLLILEPDFGTALLTGLVGLLILYAGGSRVSHLVVTTFCAASAFVIAVMHDPLRMGRVLAFLMPDKYPATAYHLAQSKVAFIRGGWFGVGLGDSIQKQFYLPEAHNDFILAIIGEELGFFATMGVILLFVGILICGLMITRQAPDPFGRLMGFGFTMMLVLQAAINMGVVTGCLPTKGLPLPFISYGGTSLVASVAAVSVLLNIARHVGDDSNDNHTRLIKDQTHRL